MSHTPPLPSLNCLPPTSTPRAVCSAPSPQAHMKLWNTHPRIYLDVAHTGAAKCPYCGTVYRLKAGEHAPAGH